MKIKEEWNFLALCLLIGIIFGAIFGLILGLIVSNIPIGLLSGIGNGIIFSFICYFQFKRHFVIK